MLKYLLLCLLLWSPAAAQELFENGNFAKSPDPQGYPGMENHGGSYALPILKGTTDLPGWTITGKVMLDKWKRSTARTIQLNDRGGIQQTVVTRPEQQYVLRFRATYDLEGAPKQAMAVKVAGRTYPITVPKGSVPQEFLFIAEGSQTTVHFVGTSEGRGLRIYRPSLTPYDPNTAKMRPIFDRTYREIMRSMNREPNKITPLLAPDFSYTSKTGETTDAAGFQKLLRKAPTESSFSSIFEDIQISQTQVELTVNQKNRYRANGESVSESLDFKDVWVKSGEDWLWKSREEL